MGHRATACYGKEKNLFLPSNAKVKSIWSSISTLPCAFKACYSNEALYIELSDG
jgi:hypothetical protein